jgi:hypothetical protein
MLIVAALTFFIVRPATGQELARLDLSGFIEVGGEAGRFLRVLQDAGLVPLTPWSIQPFAPTQAKKLRAAAASLHPWRARFDATNGAANVSDGAHLLRPEARLIGNSAFPFQIGAGPMWAGRGLTGEAQFGASASWGNLVYAQVAPLVFAAQNLSFPLAPNGQTGNLQFGDPRFPKNIDAPQRFGNQAYSRLDPGSSSVFFDNYGAVVGTTTAPQSWGPAQDYPLVLGPSAGGFPTVFLGTSTPLDFWLFRVHARLVYSRLSQSSFSPLDTGNTERLGSGFVGTIEPRGAPGLEIGAARFIHNLWPENGISFTELGRPLSSGNIFSHANNLLTENQVASIFARWALPAAKAEFYGEMYREDFPGMFHQSLSLVEKPDDLAAFTLGFQRILIASDRFYRVIHGEIVNSQVSHQEREARGFTQPIPPYIHSVELQGHTVDGLILGSPEAYGGAAWRLGLDEYSPSGRRSISLERSMRFDWLPTDTTTNTLVHPDVIYALRLELLRFHGNADWRATVIPAIDLNRNLVAGSNVFNLAVGFTFHGWF